MAVTNDFINAIKKLIEDRVNQVNTSLPGEIVEYSAPFATVRPLAKMKLPNTDSLDYPLIYGVPVIFPASSGGSCSMTFPIKPGDKVAIHFSQDGIDEFCRGGESFDQRKHSLTDAYCVPGLNNFALPVVNSNAVCIQNGGTSMVIENGRIVVTGGDLIVDGISVKHHLHSGITPGGSNTGQPV